MLQDTSESMIFQVALAAESRSLKPHNSSDPQPTSQPTAPHINEMQQRKNHLALGSWPQHFATFLNESLQISGSVGRADNSLCSGSSRCCHTCRTPRCNGLSSTCHSCLGFLHERRIEEGLERRRKT